MKIDPTEYACLRQWLGHMARQVFPGSASSPETVPIAALDRIAARSPAKARSGLMMAIGDIVDCTGTWPPASIEDCDATLARDGLPTLTDMQARFSKLVRGVVRRGRIKSAAEYHALRNAAERSTGDDTAIMSLLHAYEVEVAQKGPRDEAVH